MRLLHVVQNFRQGQGGTPESARLMARRLAASGILSDAYDGTALFERIECLDVLPVDRTGMPGFDPRHHMGRYDAILIVGPWQDPRTLLSILRHRGGRHIIYLPRGGLADNEFAGARNLKKHFYFPLVEVQILRAATAIVFSSRLEARHSSRLAGFARKHAIIPDLFDLPSLRPDVPSRGVRLSFLAEFDPRKGAAELIDGLRAWTARASETMVEVVIGGGPRPGREPYYEAVRAAGSSLDRPIVRFIGPVAHQDRADFYAASDIFLVPSKFESYCLTALEALASGCALICAPDVGVLEYLPDHHPAIVRLANVSAASIADGIDRALVQHEDARDSRDAIRAMATQAIARINDRAECAWQQLLDIPTGDNAGNAYG